MWPIQKADPDRTQLFIQIFLLQTDDTGVTELQQGGVIYLLGVIFFKLDGRLPLAHAIWHLHVVVASMIHYFAVDKYLISPDPEQKPVSAF